MPRKTARLGCALGGAGGCDDKLRSRRSGHDDRAHRSLIGYDSRVLIENPRGGYSFLRGLAPYSGGAVAARGFEIEHARFHPALPLKAGFEAIRRHLTGLGRPLQALCGIELRSPKPFTFDGFARFNAGYIEILKSWDIFQDGMNPVARTNVAPESAPPAEPALYGFSYTVPRASAEKRWPVSFVLAGAGELPEGSLRPEDVVRRGETSPAAIEAKARFVLDLMDARLRELGATWSEVTAIDVYTVHDIHPFLANLLVARAAGAPHGITWFYARPPILTIEFEIDLRACRRELLLHA
jgi:hypothetical protein